MSRRYGILLFLLLDLLPAVLPAQERVPFSHRAAVGAEVGYSRSDLVGADAERVESRQGALTGVYLQAPIHSPLFLRTEVLFALKGGRSRTPAEGGGTTDLDIELAYIELPVMLRAGVMRGRFRPMVFGGPAPSLQIGCDVQVIRPSAPVRDTCDQSPLSAFRGFDVGMVVGGGLEVRWPQSALALEARYTAGLRSVLDGADVRNRAFGVALALTF
jgi:hypothetical protein